MPDWNRRHLLATLGATAVGVGGYRWYDRDQCPDRREPDWTLDGRYWSPPTTDDYCTYVSEGYGLTGRDAAHRIASLANHDGSPNWVFTEVGAGAGVPLVADGTVYVGTGRDRVYALDQRSGHVEWRYDAGGRETYGGGAWGRPTPIRDLVAVGVSHSESANPDVTDDGEFTHRVVALGATSGEEVWTGRVDAMVWTGPVATDDAAFVATEAGSVYGFEADDGTSRWRTSVGTEIRQLFADSKRLYAASIDGQVAALDPGSGEKRWTASVSGTVRATDRDEGLLLVGTGPGEEKEAGTTVRSRTGAVVALARDSGRERWRAEGDAPIADVSSDGSYVFVLDQRGIVRVLDADGGERRDRFRVAEYAGKETCGWNPRHHRGAGLRATEDALTVTGPWVGRFPRYRE